MPDLRFSVHAIKVASSAAVPTLLFKLRIENSTREERIHSILLRCQVQIQVARRSYTAEEKENLYELFDRTGRWGKTLKSLAWTQVTSVVPGSRKTPSPTYRCRAVSISMSRARNISMRLPAGRYHSAYCLPGQFSIWARTDLCKWRKFPGIKKPSAVFRSTSGVS